MSHYRRFLLIWMTPKQNFYQTKVAGNRVIFPGEYDLTIKRALATVVFEYLPNYRFLAYFEKLDLANAPPRLPPKCDLTP